MSDDFLFDDDIVLDEAALAILDAEESKYFGSIASAQLNPRPAPTQPTPPPAKRQRTDGDGGWQHPATEIGGGSGKHVSRIQKRTDSFYEDLPDISLAGDGVYGVYSQGSQPPQNPNLTSSAGVKNTKNPLGQRQLPSGFQQPTPAPAPNTREQTPRLNQNRPPPRPPPQRTHTPPSNIPHNPNNSNRPQPQAHHRPQQPSHPQPQNPNQARGPAPRIGPIPPQQSRAQNTGPGRNVNAPRQQPQPQQPRHITSVPTHPAQSRPANTAGESISDKDLQDEVAKLRAQLEQVRRHGIITPDLCS